MKSIIPIQTLKAQFLSKLLYCAKEIPYKYKYLKKRHISKWRTIARIAVQLIFCRRMLRLCSIVFLFPAIFLWVFLPKENRLQIPVRGGSISTEISGAVWTETGGLVYTEMPGSISSEMGGAVYTEMGGSIWGDIIKPKSK